ncbi:glycoside hydrolase family 13 protein [Compostimonas suwonensis]|uniref:glycoside hydrolase family 13 protein n=1 Tax=Compostimonas suwonensis TaxID=1048394 RepID=UPI001FE99DD5|nr:alpha-amylase family glycosyl hydrolase [Compostimonas suwonensis]
MEWWNDAVVYQVYLRSFADSNGDGIGDLAGLRTRLGDLAALGVDALWLNPCFASPQRDHGYDISDYFSIDPDYGTVDELETLVESAHELGLRVLLDMVANHCSDQHEWFREAITAGAGSAARERFLFRDGRGAHGELPPNNWQSVFGGPAWTRVVEPDGRLGQWYFHAFDASQPDFDWRHPEVADHFDRVLRFWFDRGVDGFRIDVAHGLVKSAELADWPGADDGTGGHNYDMWDQPEVHEVYRRWRRIGDGYAPDPKYFVGEIWVPSVESLADYLGPEQLHQAFGFDLLVQPWNADRMRAAVDRGLGQSARTATPPAWTLANHDVHRTVTRYGQAQDLSAPVPSDMIAAARRHGPADLELGVRRARAAAMLLLALPGTSYLYQGEELGLPEVVDLPRDARQDPIWVRSGGAELGRDGCRVPLPWSADAASFGFSPAGAALPWLPQPAWFGDFAADTQQHDPSSTLSLYRELLHSRRALFAPSEPLLWLASDNPELLVFARGSAICAVNFGERDAALPLADDARVLVRSTSGRDIPGTTLPANSAVWLTTATGPEHHGLRPTTEDALAR